MLIDNQRDLEKNLHFISNITTTENSFSKNRLELLRELYSELKLLRSNFEAISLSLYLRSILKINFLEKYPRNAFGLGLVVHYGPGNLPINSIYSWITGFICGNINVVRSSTKTTIQQLEIIKLVSSLCKKNSFLDIFFISKEADEFAKLTSKYCQARIIWGSNSVVNFVRKLDCNPNCRDIIFGDRKSAGILNFDLIDTFNDMRQKFLVTALANDLFYADSQPCTSPSVLFLISKNNKKEILLKKIKDLLIRAEELSNKKENWSLSSFSNQIQHLQYYAIDENQPIFSNFDSSRLKLAIVSNPTFQKRLYRTFEIVLVKDFNDLSENLLSNFNIFICEGISNEQKFLLNSNKNCTKVTSVGNAHQFNLIWDGIDTVRSLIRIPQIS